MGRARTIGRRAFLIGSAAVLGGVAFGVYRASIPKDNPLAEGLGEDAVTFNPWVQIDAEKITLIAPHGDKGQGVFSAQAALIAEELDVELDQVEISFGMPSPAYYNTAMAGELLPFMSIDDSTTAQMARRFAGGAMRAFLPLMGTGGSTAMPDSFDKLRRAGAVARETLKAAAAAREGVDVASLKTEKGAVILPDGRAIPYTELAEAAAKIEPVQRVTLRTPDQWRMIGKPMQRVDITAKSTGTQAYGIDFEMEDMVYATVKVNPRQGGGLNGYDASAAEAMRGVQKILPITNGVAVVADNTWRAIRAAEAIEYDWGDAPYPAEQDGHWAVLSESFVPERINAEARAVGDVEAAYGASAGKVEAEYRSPYVAHAPLEPLNATILVTESRVDIWSGHQVQVFAQNIVGEVTGHGPDQVHLHNQFMGGSFGHRLEFDYLRQAAEIAMQMPGVPVKMTYSREEDFAHDFPRHITMGRIKGSHAGGKVTGLDVEIAAPSVIGSQMSRMGFASAGPDTQLHAGAWDNPYLELANLRVRSYKAPGLAPVSSWRSVGAAPNGFIFDTGLDEVIHAAGADPLEERIRLMGHDVSRKVLEAVGEMSSWGGTLAPNRARGVAFVLSFGVPVAEVIEVENTEDGIRIHKVWMAADVGQVVDPVNLENMAQGGVVFGLGHAMNCEITYSDGMAEQSNFDSHEGMRHYQCPEIAFRALENADHIRGFGEPPVPPTAPALGNAIFAATGQRIREMPFNKHIDFV